MDKRRKLVGFEFNDFHEMVIRIIKQLYILYIRLIPLNTGVLDI
jgi:hypothetical protein